MLPLMLKHLEARYAGAELHFCSIEQRAGGTRVSLAIDQAPDDASAQDMQADAEMFKDEMRKKDTVILQLESQLELLIEKVLPMAIESRTTIDTQVNVRDVSGGEVVGKLSNVKVDPSVIRLFLEEIRGRDDALREHLSAEQHEKLKSELVVIAQQLEGAKGDPSILKSAASAVRRVAEGVAGKVISQKVLEQLTNLPD